MPAQDVWEIQIEGFGPFGDRSSWSLLHDAPGVVLYAGNGQGKTCLSRLFRSAEVGADSLSDCLLCLDGEEGFLSFEAIEKGRARGPLTVGKTRGVTAHVDNQTGYLFHVFNADYVQSNLAQHHYAPSGDIRGYLMGKESIELEEKRKRLAELGEAGRQRRLAVDEAVARAKADLKALGINPRFKEYVELTTERVLGLPLESTYYDSCLRDYLALRSLPDDIQVEMVFFARDQVDFPMLEELLSTSYTRDLFSEAFLAAASQKKPFITQGLALMHDDTCPFCGQSLGEQARSIIHLYEDYLGGQEALIVETLESESLRLTGLKEAYFSFSRSYRQRRELYDRLSDAIFEAGNHELRSMPATHEFNASVDALSEELRVKAADISCVSDTSAAETLRELLEEIDQAVEDANQLAYDLNKALQHGSTQLREAKRELCREAAKRVRVTCDDDISELMRLRGAYGQLRAEIQRQEAEGHQSMRDAVADLLEQLLQEVFDGKYRFDRRTFSLVFQATVLGESAEEVLSDGEKTAVAFCHYIASTIELLNDANDASRLLFVVDDPVTGIDIPHAQRLANAMRNMDSLLGLPQLRLLVLTHDAGCFAMLHDGKTSLTGYVLEDGSVYELAQDA